MSNLILGLTFNKLNYAQFPFELLLCVIFNIFLRAILVYFIRKVEIVTILDRVCVVFFQCRLFFFGNAYWVVLTNS